MSSTYISAKLRHLVRTRAASFCEYCLIHEDDTYFGCQIDHIVSEKHGGPTEVDNLAYACSFCNRYKGSDIGSIAWDSGEFVRFYNPRLDKWSDHFRIDGIKIISLTDIGEVTTRILEINNPDRLLERQELHNRSRYPLPEVVAFINMP